MVFSGVSKVLGQFGVGFGLVLMRFEILRHSLENRAISAELCISL